MLSRDCARRCSTLSSWTRPPSWRTPVTEWSVCVSLTHSLCQLDHPFLTGLLTHSHTPFIHHRSFPHLIAYPLTHSSTHFYHSYTYSLTHSFTDTLTQSALFHSLAITHSTHSLTRLMDSGTSNRGHSK